MRRAVFAVVAGLMVVALVAPITTAAQPAPSFRANSSAAEPGGAFHVQAKVLHWTRGSTFSAEVTVHFKPGDASGDVTMAMKRSGKSFVALARVPVPADQPLGPVAMDVTVTYNGTPYAVPTFNGMVVEDTD